MKADQPLRELDGERERGRERERDGVKRYVFVLFCFLP